MKNWLYVTILLLYIYYVLCSVTNFGREKFGVRQLRRIWDTNYIVYIYCAGT